MNFTPESQPFEDPDGRPSASSAQSGDAALFAAAQRRLKARAEAGDGQVPPMPKDPAAIAAMSGPENPVRRFFAGRNARPATMQSYRTRLSIVQRLLVEAGFRRGTTALPLEEFPWHCVTPADAGAFFQLVATRYSVAKSRENVIGPLRKMVRNCARAGLMTLDEREAVLECLPVRADVRSQAGREISGAELELLVRGNVPTNALGLRDTAMLEILICSGMRSAELVDLRLGDWDAAAGTLWIQRQKTGRGRSVLLTNGARRALEAWLAVRGDESGALFTRVPTPPGGPHLNAVTVNEVIARRCTHVGINQRITSHDFRRTMITRLLRAGIDPFQVARLVDHRNVATTMIYDRRTETEDHAAFALLELPSGPAPTEDAVDNEPEDAPEVDGKAAPEEGSVQ